MGERTHPECRNNSITLRNVSLETDVVTRAPSWQLSTRFVVLTQPNLDCPAYKVPILHETVTARLPCWQR